MEAAVQGGIVRGGESTSHANDGVKYIVKSTGQHVELEGDEIVLCENLMQSDKFYSLTGTPLEIIKTLADEYGCKRGTLNEIHGGEFVICKKVVRDGTPISVAGTPKEIISYLQVEKGCKAHWSYEYEKHNQETCKTCKHEMEKGGGVQKKGKGDCFLIAGKAMTDFYYGHGRKYFGTPYVVHAEVSGEGSAKGVRFAHAWIEDDYLVYDFANGNEIITAKQLYYRVGKIKTTDPKKYRRYDENEYMDKLLEHDNYGWWDLDCKYEAGGNIYKVTIPSYMGAIRLKDGGGLTAGTEELCNAILSYYQQYPEECNAEYVEEIIGFHQKVNSLSDSVIEKIRAEVNKFIKDQNIILAEAEVTPDAEKEEVILEKEEVIPEIETIETYYGFKTPKSTATIALNIQRILAGYISRDAASHQVEAYLNAISDKNIVKEFLRENKITNRAELKDYCRAHQFKARYGARKKINEDIERVLTGRYRRMLDNQRDNPVSEKFEFETGGIIPSDSKVTYFYEPDTMMPLDATWENGALYQTSMAMFASGGAVTEKSANTPKTTLEKIRELRLQEIGLRFSSYIRTKYYNTLDSIEAYLMGNVKVLSSAKGMGYKSATLNDADEVGARQRILIKAGMEHMPVPDGLWMDDLRSKLSLSEQARLDNNNRIKLAGDNFWKQFAEFYMPAEYLKWYRAGEYRKRRNNNYWTDRLGIIEGKQMATGGAVADKPTEKEIEERWDKKKDHIMQLATSLRSLRYNLTADMKSDDEKEKLTALVIAMMDKTGERVGNEESAEEGHIGITGLKKKNITISGNKISLGYVGKSGVDQLKSFSDDFIAGKLREAIKNTPDDFVFTTTDGFKIKNDRVNRYLQEYGTTAKDMRGFYANKHIQKKLEREPVAKEEKDREKQFREAVKYAAGKVGHGAATLKTHYLIPELEKAFILNGKIIDLSDFYKTGGIVKLANGGHVEVPGTIGMPSRTWARSAAGVLLVAYDTGRCLWLKRGSLLPEGDTWALLSGGIEAGETPKEALMREIEEEVGHKEDVCFKLSYIHNSKDDDFGFYTFIGVVAKEFIPKLNFENSEYKWTDYRDIPTPLHFGVAEFIQNVNLRHELIYALELYLHLKPHANS